VLIKYPFRVLELRHSTDRVTLRDMPLLAESAAARSGLSRSSRRCIRTSMRLARSCRLKLTMGWYSRDLWQCLRSASFVRRHQPPRNVKYFVDIHAWCCCRRESKPAMRRHGRGAEYPEGVANKPHNKVANHEAARSSHKMSLFDFRKWE
jgi:hypothetical protein